MADKIEVLTSPRQVQYDPRDLRNGLVHRKDIADAANALLLALRNEPEAEGVIMLARSFGCVEVGRSVRLEG